ncbi:MAG: hypothetical protein K6T63_05485 [Alicyclobacillus herbarius]|uniref:CdaR family protein n=1 Tax=Alicyclobacillus herbarius TaxID=122960 RepID=UPI00235414E0|nr:CdaR family protein [Alicyclobacillus herbarius]MCL6632069.1 hypothetical protein [Alicyclobacillus herbarius]
MSRFWSNNNVLRIIALALSCILWFTVQPSPDTSAVTNNVSVSKFPIAVHVRTSDDTVVTSVSPSAAIVAVHDSTVNLQSLTEQMLNVQLVADVRGLGPGQHQVPLTAEHMPLVQYSLSPSSVTVVIADRKTDERPVRVIVRGQPASGYTVGNPDCDVATVKVSGSAQALGRVSTVAAFVSVQGANDSVSQEVTLAAIDARGNPVDGVTVTPATAHVTVPIVAPHQSVPIRLETSGSPAAGYDVAGLTPSVSSVTLYGIHLPKHLTIPVDVSGLNRSKTVSVKAPLPDGATRASPSTVSVRVQIEPSAVRSFTVPLTIRNVPAGETVSVVNPSQVTVHVSGPKSVVGGLKANAIRAYVDAKGLKPGDTRGPIQVDVPSGVRVTQLSPANAEVQVSQS